MVAGDGHDGPAVGHHLGGRSDEIRGAALQRLLWDTEIPGDAIRVSVKDGWVTLNGVVLFQLQSDEAFNRVASLHGVTGVTNRITVVESR